MTQEEAAREACDFQKAYDRCMAEIKSAVSVGRKHIHFKHEMYVAMYHKRERPERLYAAYEQFSKFVQQMKADSYYLYFGSKDNKPDHVYISWEF